MVGIYKDNFKEFEGSVLTNPVGVEDSQVSAFLSNSIFSNGSVRSVGFQLVDSLVNSLSINNTLADGLLSSSSSDSDSVDNVSLLSLVSKLSCLVNS